MDAENESGRGEKNARAADILDIHHVMKLAKLDLNQNELEHFGSELNKILGYIDMIKEADVSRINDILNELEYDKLARGVNLDSEFYKDCRIDECKTDAGLDFGIVKNNAPSFEIQSAGSENGFFVVPQIIE